MKGWFMSGSHPGDYDHGIADDEKHDGHAVAYIRSRLEHPAGFGTLMQMIAAEEYRGKRMRFSGAVRSIDVAGWAGLWMRVDGDDRKHTLAFDNMQDRPITGTSDWATYTVVLDVADRDSTQVAFGLLLAGPGEVWLADVRIEAVGHDVPTTGGPRAGVPDHPVNLDFAESGAP